MKEFDELLNNIDVSNLKGEDEVRKYYSILIDFFSAHRQLLLRSRRLNVYRNVLQSNTLNNITINNIDKELTLNTLYTIYLNKLLSLLDKSNYEDIYRLCIIIINNYCNNVRYLQGKIRQEKLKLKNINYNSNISYNTKEFNDFIKEKYEKIKNNKSK